MKTNSLYRIRPFGLALSACLALSTLSGCIDLSGITLPSPSVSPTATPSTQPTTEPSTLPTGLPTSVPTAQPTVLPSPGSWVPVGSGYVDQPVESVLAVSAFVKPGFALSNSGNGSLSLSKNYVKPGKPISVNFTAGSGFTDKAWIGIIPANIPHGDENVNDANDIAWQYLGKQSAGELNFTAPGEEKTYDFRLNPNDNGGVEAASVSFVVTRELPPEEQAQSKLWLDKNHVKPGKPIVVRFTAPASFGPGAWIGIVPAETPHGEEVVNDQHDVSWKYLEGKTGGEMTFTAPNVEGRFDLRLHDTNSNGKEACYATVIVTRELSAAEIAASSLRLDRSNYQPGETIQLNFTAPASFDSTAWIGILPANIVHGEEDLNDKHDISWKYLEGKTSGVLEFKAPSVSGSYDFRLHDSNNGKEAVYISFTVAS